MPHACIVTKSPNPLTRLMSMARNDNDKTHICENQTDEKALCGAHPIEAEQNECDCHPVRGNRGTCGKCEKICHQNHPEHPHGAPA
jgi:hypothetical protein